jgi:4,5-DOPA dioxygenase extradiol
MGSTEHHETAHRTPVLFVGHGSPMNAIEDNPWSRGFRALAAMLPRPRAILSVSAHWFVPRTMLTAQKRPRTVHDFSGFPRELYEIRYPAPGDPALAGRVARLAGAERASLSEDWGLDHGTWSVLRHLYPEADVPVVQLSIDSRKPASDHLAFGRALAPLREQGVLIVGSGNVTHNLRHAMEAYDRPDLATPAWASKFDAEVAQALGSHDLGFLVRALETAEGRMSHPTPDHYLPLLYAAGASDAKDNTRFPLTGFDLASLSMRAALFD